MKKHFILRFFSALAGMFFFGSLIGFIALILIMNYYNATLPDYQQLKVYEPLTTTRVYSSDGSLLEEYASEKRVFLPISAMPDKLVKAFVSAEDKHFYSHSGVDYLGIVRAIVVNVKNWGTNKRPVGASTITQQVAKNFFLSNEVSIVRKIKEMLLAKKMEQAFTKEHILELYLNQIFLGQRSYGVASAAMTYFNKSVDELTLPEMAYLAALPKGPNNYHPVRNHDAAVKRRNYVLGRMYEDKYITKQELDEALKAPLEMTGYVGNEVAEDAEFYSEEVRKMVEKQYGNEALYHGGLSIRTALDPNLQKIAVQVLFDGLVAYDRRHGYRGPVKHIEEISLENLKSIEIPPYIPDNWYIAVVKGITPEIAQISVLKDDELLDGQIPLSELKWARKPTQKGYVGDKIEQPSDVLSIGDVVYVANQKEQGFYSLQQYPTVQGALVAMNPHTGRVLAMMGGSDFQKSKFNRAVQAYRQPGSSIKPIVYLTALDNGYNPSSLVLDAPLVIDQGPGMPKWKPMNYTKVFYGPTTLRKGIEASRNLITIRLAQAVGMDKVVQYVKKFGISDTYQPLLSYSIGSGETTLLKMTTAYSMLVNGGKKISPIFIDRIQDRSGRTIYKYDTRACENCTGEEAKDNQVPNIPDLRQQVQDPVSAYQMVNIMKGVVDRGTGKIAKAVGKTLAGKSGTSNDSLDTWFIGFSPDLVVGIWVGFDDNQTLGAKETGSVVAGPIFRDFMKQALKNTADMPFRIPKGVKLVLVNYTTGLPAKTGEKSVLLEAFRQETDLNNPTPIVGADITIKQDHVPDMGGFY